MGSSPLGPDLHAFYSAHAAAFGPGLSELRREDCLNICQITEAWLAFLSTGSRMSLDSELTLASSYRLAVTALSDPRRIIASLMTDRLPLIGDLQG